MRPESDARRRRFGLILVAAGALLLLPISDPAAVAQERVLTVTHAATSTTLTTPNSNGHQLGDLRVDSLATKDESGGAGRLDATLTTTGIDTPAPGDEVRIGQLVFSFADRSQIFVGGVAVYPGKGSTIAVASTAVRPILGGSGKYQGAAGWCESVHLPDGSWKHIFHLAGGTAAR
jgi:hypothetical protein